MKTVARLVVRTGTPGLLLLRPGQYVIGRHSDCDLILNAREISRRHASVEVDENSCSTLVDLGSRNGTNVNGKRVDRCQLSHGALITISTVTCLFESMVADEFTDEETTPAPITPAEILPRVSPAEQRVLFALLGGLSEKETAAKLSISPHTVHNHIKQIYLAYQVNSKAELLALFISRPNAMQGF